MSKAAFSGGFLACMSDCGISSRAVSQYLVHGRLADLQLSGYRRSAQPLIMQRSYTISIDAPLVAEPDSP